MRNKKGERKQDAFYDILKDRVAAVLREKGIDPVKDRGASFSRNLHYSLIFVAFLGSGHAHVKVSCGRYDWIFYFTPFRLSNLKIVL
jgi:hypothetical protein